jgi:hypothetical protein
MYPITLLRRLTSAKFPLHLIAIDDIRDAIELKQLGWIQAAIPSPSKGRHTYGQQGPTLVLAITSAGHAALTESGH